jgi:hypothetical protein
LKKARDPGTSSRSSMFHFARSFCGEPSKTYSAGRKSKSVTIGSLTLAQRDPGRSRFSLEKGVSYNAVLKGGACLTETLLDYVEWSSPGFHELLTATVAGAASLALPVPLAAAAFQASVAAMSSATGASEVSAGCKECCHSGLSDGQDDRCESVFGKEVEKNSTEGTREVRDAVFAAARVRAVPLVEH